MKKRDYSTKQIVIISLMSIAMLVLAVLLNHFLQVNSRETAAQPASTSFATATPAAVPTESPKPTATPDPTKKIATFLQGPKSWKKRLNWSGHWSEEFYDGGSFGSFGCGLCCMANIYTTFSGHQCSPTDMYQYAKKMTDYGGGGAIDWGYMKAALQSAGFSSDVWRKPKQYTSFQKKVKDSLACIVVVSSYDSDVYWENTAGHYVTIFTYDEKTDRVFLADSGNPDHNRKWVKLDKIYRSLKKSNKWQILAVTRFDAKKDKWQHKGFGGTCVLPQGW